MDVRVCDVLSIIIAISRARSPSTATAGSRAPLAERNGMVIAIRPVFDTLPPRTSTLSHRCFTLKPGVLGSRATCSASRQFAHPNRQMCDAWFAAFSSAPRGARAHTGYAYRATLQQRRNHIPHEAGRFNTTRAPSLCDPHASFRQPTRGRTPTVGPRPSKRAPAG